MRAKADPAEIKKLFPDEYDKVLASMRRKGISDSDIEWSYSWCMQIVSSWGKEPDPETLEAIVDDIKKRYSVAIMGSFGRKQSGEPIDIKKSMPRIFQDMAKSTFDRVQAEKSHENNKASNLDSVLESVGKSGSSKPPKGVTSGFYGIFGAVSSAPVYPTLEDIKTSRPDVYQKYIDSADGTKLIVYNPGARDCDEWGFREYHVELATRRGKEIRLITPVEGLSSLSYVLDGDTAKFNGSLRQVDKARAAAEGTNFRGWKNTNQYRYTKDEIANMIGGKIFLHAFGFPF